MATTPRRHRSHRLGRLLLGAPAAALLAWSVAGPAAAGPPWPGCAEADRTLAALGTARLACGSLRFVPLARVYFPTDGHRLDAAARAALERAAAWLRGRPRLRRVLVVGHADVRASAAYNEALARRRAETVRAFLAARGVPEALLVVRSLGEARPQDVSWTSEGRRRNRRVELFAVEALVTLGPAAPLPALEPPPPLP